MDSFNIIRKIEKIYKESKPKITITKRSTVLVIIPIVGTLSMLLTLVIISNYYIILALAIFLAWGYFGNRCFFKEQYEPTIKSEIELRYKGFKEEIQKNNISKDTLIMVKGILEIETKEETKISNIYIIYVLLPIIYFVMEDYIKANKEISLFAILLILLLPLTNSINGMRKKNVKRERLNQIERMILEL